jgi:hypothetical protein
MSEFIAFIIGANVGVGLMLITKFRKEFFDMLKDPK